MKRGNLLLGAAIIILVLTTPTIFGREPLTFEQRVKAQEAIEKVYYNHRIWPKENPQLKPPFEKMVTKEQIEAKVTDYLKKSAALEKFWYRPITGEQLQAEMDRMAKGTKDPATLNELFEALNNDPYLIAECLARPVLADRLVRNWYANDERFHKETREKAEEALKHLTPENFCSYPEGQYSIMTYRLENEETVERENLHPEGLFIELSENEFTRIIREIPEKGHISGIQEHEDSFAIVMTIEKNESEVEIRALTFKKVPLETFIERSEIEPETANMHCEGNYKLSFLVGNSCVEQWEYGMLALPYVRHTAVWTGSEMIVWGESHDDILSFVSSCSRYNPLTDSWAAVSMAGAPSARRDSTAVWTGTEMIIWGGEYSEGNGNLYPDTGGRYNPLSDSWVETARKNAPSGRSQHSALWTGTEMIIWGVTSKGARYNPLADSWAAISTEDQPEIRYRFSLVWTGTEMIVWGGFENGRVTNKGGIYNPSSNRWKATSLINAPGERGGHTAVWTGTGMIVWGGANNANFLNSGSFYNPTSDSWAPISTTDAPSARSEHSAVWTGTEMVVWGGTQSESPSYVNSGARYNPSKDRWTQMSLANAPSGRYEHTAVWTGKEMIVWGGGTYGDYRMTGGRYNPALDTWITLAVDIPTGRSYHSSVWTGCEMIVWGGQEVAANPGETNTGARYNPILDSWKPVSLENAPLARRYHGAVWTGTEMLIWGGDIEGASDDGGRYNPIIDSWGKISAVNAPSERDHNTTIWTGEEMIVWGGWHGSIFKTGGRYNPGTDSWTATSTSNAPEGREHHTAVWDGSGMIIWGGDGSNGYLDTGGKFYPSSDEWVPISSSNAPEPRGFHTAVLCGDKMIVWGGFSFAPGDSKLFNDGGIYDPSSDSWEPISTTDAPSARSGHSAVWTGTEMIIWGGMAEAMEYWTNKGARYSPDSDEWVPTSVTRAPSARDDHTAVWTGSSMIVWGGEHSGYLNNGGIYTPESISAMPVVSEYSRIPCPSPSVTLFVVQSFSTYQWNLDGVPITGANSASYIAATTGSYNVSVTDQNGCFGTSKSYEVEITKCPGVSGVTVASNPFRLHIFGAEFQPGAVIKIDGTIVPQTVFKDNTHLIAKKGATLKALVPKGTTVMITVVNPDGGVSEEFPYTR